MWQHPLFQDPHILQEKQSEMYLYTRCCLMSAKKKITLYIDGVQSQEGGFDTITGGKYSISHAGNLPVSSDFIISYFSVANWSEPWILRRRWMFLY